MELSFEAGPLAHVYPWQRAVTPPPLREQSEERAVQRSPAEQLETVTEAAQSRGLAHVFPFHTAVAPPSIESQPDWEAVRPVHRSEVVSDIPVSSPSTTSLSHVFPFLGAATPPPVDSQVETNESEKVLEIAPEPEVVPESVPEPATANQESLEPSLESSVSIAEPLLADVSSEELPAVQEFNAPLETSQQPVSALPTLSDLQTESESVAAEPAAYPQDDSLPVVDGAPSDKSIMEETMEDRAAHSPPAIPISKTGNRYLLFDTNDISYLRRNHNVCGVLIGTLPGHPQQNVFLGTPLELMPEEARLLVEEGVAYIVDDVEAHKTGVMGLGEAERKAFSRVLEMQGLDAMRASQKKANDLKEIAMKKNADKIAAKRKERLSAETTDAASTDDTASLFASSSARPSSPSPSTMSKTEERFYITPSTSHPPLPSPPLTPPTSATLPDVPNSYPLFAHMHSKGYFMTPGLRFGCQYCVYPGDPLRFHSHFLGVGMDWDEEFDLMQVVGGGRLGTGVKKGFLLGGKEPKEEEAAGGDGGDNVRTFCVEWSGM